jgi:hypothetical protein
MTPHIETARERLVQKLCALRSRDLRITADQQVFEWFNRYLADLEAERQRAPNANLVGIIGGRTSWMAMRIAILLVAADGTNHVNLPHLLRGIEIAERWRHNAIRVFDALAPSQFERKAARVVQLVDQRRDVIRRDVMRALHINVRDMNDIEATLKERGEILVLQGGSGVSRSTRYQSLNLSQVSQLSPRTFSESPPENTLGDSCDTCDRSPSGHSSPDCGGHTVVVEL